MAHGAGGNTLLFGGLGAAALLGALPGVAAAAEAAPIDTGDTAWLLMSTALVMVMLPGLALFYGGLVRKKNVLSTIMHSFFGLALVTIVWVIVGFSLSFAPSMDLPVLGTGIIGGLVVKLGSRMVDSSLRTKLNSIKTAMKEAR